MSNIPRLEFWLDVINAGVAISLAASFLFGVASIVLSRQLGKIKDTQAAAEKVASDEKIAGANAEAAKALGGLSESNERIAGLNKEAEALRAEAEKAKAERAEADKQIAIAKADAAQATERTAEISLKVEEEARKRVEAQRALLELQERLKDRHLDVKAQADFLEVLKAYPIGKIQVGWTESDAEVESFAKEFLTLLRTAKWEVSLGGFMRPHVGKGITIGVKDATRPPAQLGLRRHLPPQASNTNSTVGDMPTKT